MRFALPALLWLLAVPLALLSAGLLRRRRDATGAVRMVQGEARGAAIRIRPSATGIRTARWVALHLGLMLAIVALARPQWGRIEEPVFDQAREILLAVDLSRSMLAPDVKPSRLDRAKLLIQALLEQLRGERVGLIVFAGTAFLQSPLSSDYEILNEFLPALSPDYLPAAGTDYAALLRTALEAFSSEGGADRFLIVLSDGEANDDSWKPLAEDLRKRDVRVLGLGIGTAAGAMLPERDGGFVKDERGAVVLSRLEPATLRTLASTTGGAYRDASAWVDLAALVRETVEAGRMGEFRETASVRFAERYQWALVPAFLLFAFSFWRELPVRPRPREVTLESPSS
jgi:Ca-activated chloride channel homolog